MSKIRRSNVKHCLQPRGYPRKICSDVLTNIYTITKQNITIFWGGFITSKKNTFMSLENHHFGSQNEKIGIFECVLCANGARTLFILQGH